MSSRRQSQVEEAGKAAVNHPYASHEDSYGSAVLLSEPETSISRRHNLESTSNGKIETQELEKLSEVEDFKADDEDSHHHKGRNKKSVDDGSDSTMLLEQSTNEKSKDVMTCPSNTVKANDNEKPKQSRKRKGKGHKKSKKKVDALTQQENGSNVKTSIWQKLKKERNSLGIKKGRATSQDEVENPLTLIEDARDDKLSTRKQRYTLPDGQIGEMSGDHRWDEASLGDLQKQLDSELEGSEYDPKTLEKLHVALRAITLEKSQKQADHELQNMNEEISKKSLRTNSWMTYPRVPNIHCCRFELPVDGKKLIDLSPTRYLATYCIVPRNRRQLISKVFAKHRGMDNYLKYENLGGALADIFGETVKNDLLEMVFSLAELDSEFKIEFGTFVGLAALAERLLCNQMGAGDQTTKDTIEVLDFSNLETYLEGLQISQPINKLLTWIQNS